VRDVAAHVAMTPTEPTIPALAAALVRARGNLWSAGARIAINHANHSPATIVDELRRNAAARTMPIITNAENVLMDALVHGQDIAPPSESPVPCRPLRPAQVSNGYGQWDGPSTPAAKCKAKLSETTTGTPH
jgi:hypothetical protein